MSDYSSGKVVRQALAANRLATQRLLALLIVHHPELISPGVDRDKVAAAAKGLLASWIPIRSHRKPAGAIFEEGR